MPIRTKYTMIFDLSTNATGQSQGTRVGGWTESYYRDGSLTDTFKTLFLQLCQRRANMLPRPARIVGQRYQQVDPVGASSTGSVPYPGSVLWVNDVPQMALLCRIGGAGLPNFRQLELRALPDVCAFEGEYRPDGAFSIALDAFVDELVDRAWQFRARDLQATTVPIISIDSNGVYQLAEPLTLALHQRVQVLRTRDEEGFVSGGFFYSDASTTFNGSLVDWIGGDNRGGKMRPANTVYPVFSRVGFGIRGVAVRKVGRPLFAYRGRVSNRH